MYSTLSDEALVKEILDGDINAFTQLHERYRRAVYASAFRILRDPEEARDAAQEIFFKIYRSLHMWKPQRSKLATWILKLAANHSIDCHRCRSRHAEYGFPEGNAESFAAPSHSSRSPYSAAKSNETIGLIRRCLGTLPDLQKKVFEQRYFQEQKLVEIAETERCNLSTVKTSLYRATRIVREGLLKLMDAPA